ncbi:MAG: PAS domain S-box protein [Candidatus Eisenbacteria bacterium]|nr:PAS domain S-box protein [Candidatus Latescibacterota bacterium]MBD3300901.1 PAS domain S-box protein [Candidatus Eisenbacteria bacterium]
MRVRTRTRDGEWTSMTLLPIRSDAPDEDGVIVVLADSKEHGTDQGAFQRFGVLLAALKDAVILFDVEGGITAWNRGAQSLYGYSEEEAARIGLFALMPPEEREPTAERVLLVSRGERVEVARTKRKTKDGQVLSVEQDLLLIRDHSGAVEAIAAIEHDVTEMLKRKELLRLLHDISMTLNETTSLGPALTYVLQRLAEHNGWAVGHAYFPAPKEPDVLLLRQSHYAKEAGPYSMHRGADRPRRLRRGEGLAGRVFDSGKAEWSTDATTNPDSLRMGEEEGLPVRSAVAFPVLSGKEVVGVLEFLSENEIELVAETHQAMTSVGMQLGRAVERQRNEQELMRATIDEQERIGRDLHDTVQQELAGIALSADILRGRLKKRGVAEADDVGGMVSALRESIDHMRSVITGLAPVDVISDGLPHALRTAVESTCAPLGIRCQVECEEGIPIDDPLVGTNLFRIASEAVINSARHSEAGTISVRLERDGNHLVLEVKDDGRGFKPSEPRQRGMGLRIMKHRADLIDAILDVRSADGDGTVVRCRVPLDRLS